MFWQIIGEPSASVRPFGMSGWILRSNWDDPWPRICHTICLFIRLRSPFSIPLNLSTTMQVNHTIEIREQFGTSPSEWAVTIDQYLVWRIWNSCSVMTTILWGWTDKIGWRPQVWTRLESRERTERYDRHESVKCSLRREAVDLE
jgi:hypothetical protein